MAEPAAVEAAIEVAPVELAQPDVFKNKRCVMVHNTDHVH
jgi:hypothetical protein